MESSLINESIDCTEIDFLKFLSKEYGTAIKGLPCDNRSPLRWFGIINDLKKDFRVAYRNEWHGYTEDYDEKSKRSHRYFDHENILWRLQSFSEKSYGTVSYLFEECFENGRIYLVLPKDEQCPPGILLDTGLRRKMAEAWLQSLSSNNFANAKKFLVFEKTFLKN